MYIIIFRSCAFPDCFFVDVKNRLMPGSDGLSIAISDFCESWEVGQILGGN